MPETSQMSAGRRSSSPARGGGPLRPTAPDSSPVNGGRGSKEGVPNDRTETRKFAKALRRKLTRAETILWSRLRRDQIAGYRFRRQHPIGPYVADFACVPAMLVVEVDGATHSTDEELDHDRKRDAYLKKHGWRVCRVWNEDVYKNSDGVLEAIYALLRAPESDRSSSKDR